MAHVQMVTGFCLSDFPGPGYLYPGGSAGHRDRADDHQLPVHPGRPRQPGKESADGVTGMLRTGWSDFCDIITMTTFRNILILLTMTTMGTQLHAGAQD